MERPRAGSGGLGFAPRTGVWRRERDSNPRDGFPPTHFPGVRLRPLGHLSGEPRKCHGTGRRGKPVPPGTSPGHARGMHSMYAKRMPSKSVRIAAAKCSEDPTRSSGRPGQRDAGAAPATMRGVPRAERSGAVPAGAACAVGGSTSSASIAPRPVEPHGRETPEGVEALARARAAGRCARMRGISPSGEAAISAARSAQAARPRSGLRLHAPVVADVPVPLPAQLGHRAARRVPHHRLRARSGSGSPCALAPHAPFHVLGDREAGEAADRLEHRRGAPRGWRWRRSRGGRSSTPGGCRRRGRRPRRGSAGRVRGEDPHRAAEDRAVGVGGEAARGSPAASRDRRCSRNRGRRRSAPAPARCRGCAPAPAPGSARRPAACRESGRRAPRAAPPSRCRPPAPRSGPAPSRCAASDGEAGREPSGIVQVRDDDADLGVRPPRRPARAAVRRAHAAAALDPRRGGCGQNPAGAGPASSGAPAAKAAGGSSPPRRRPRGMSVMQTTCVAVRRTVSEPRGVKAAPMILADDLVSRRSPGSRRTSASSARAPVGIVTALALADRGFRVLVLESGGEGAGAGGRGSRGRREPAARQPFRAAHRRRAPARRQLEPLGRALRALRSDRLPRPALARPAGLADRRGRSRARTWPRRSARSGPGRRSSTAPLAGWPRTRRSAATRSSAGATCRASRSCTPRALASRARPPGGAARARCSAFAIGADGGIAGLELDVGGRAGGSCRRRGWCSPPAATPAPGSSCSSRRASPRASAAPAARSGASTWATSPARSPTSSSRTRRCTTGSTTTSTRTAPTCAAGWCPPRRRRRRKRLANVAFWPVVPPIANAAHRSGPLSAVFLALSLAPLGRRLIAEPVRLKHVGPPPYRRGAAPAERRARPAAHARLRAGLPLEEPASRRMRLPGFFLRNPRPALRARVPRRAAAGPGQPADARAGAATGSASARLRIDLRFARSRRRLGRPRRTPRSRRWLARNRLARLEYYAGRPAARIDGGARERQGRRAPGRHHPHGRRAPGRGWSTRRCRAFGAPGLFVVSTAVLPSSGQANPTLTAVQLGLRLADDLAAGRV